VESLPLKHLWRGSSNQSLVPLSDRGRARYATYVEAAADSFGKRIQAGVDGQRIWFVGIPARGDMAALEATCAARGIELSKVSWRQ
jgi:anaerobic ribonucleoside-triphosphate reductase activating protein